MGMFASAMGIGAELEEGTCSVEIVRLNNDGARALEGNRPTRALEQACYVKAQDNV